MLPSSRHDKVPKRQSTVEQQIRDLQKRVARLERPVRSEKQRRADEQFWADYQRRSAEIDARSKVMREYYAAEREQRLRDNPNALRIAVDLERKENAFLESKGLKPNASQIPPALRRKAKGLSRT